MAYPYTRTPDQDLDHILQMCERDDLPPFLVTNEDGFFVRSGDTEELVKQKIGTNVKLIFKSHSDILNPPFFRSNVSGVFVHPEIQKQPQEVNFKLDDVLLHRLPSGKLHFSMSGGGQKIKTHLFLSERFIVVIGKDGDDELGINDNIPFCYAIFRRNDVNDNKEKANEESKKPSAKKRASASKEERKQKEQEREQKAQERKHKKENKRKKQKKKKRLKKIEKKLENIVKELKNLAKVHKVDSGDSDLDILLISQLDSLGNFPSLETLLPREETKMIISLIGLLGGKKLN